MSASPCSPMLLWPSSVSATDYSARIRLSLRLSLSYRDLQDPAERGLEISYETVRRGALKFGAGGAKATETTFSMRRRAHVSSTVPVRLWN